MATPREATLLYLVQIVSDYATSDAEVVAIVAHLINSGTVRLCGNFAGAKIDLPPAAYAVPLSSLSRAGLARDAASATEPALYSLISQGKNNGMQEKRGTL